MASKRNFALILVAATVIVAVVFPFTCYEENSIRLYWYFPVFSIGILFSMLYTKTYERLKKHVIWDVCGILIFLVILLLTPPMRKLIWGIEPSGWLQNKYLLFAFLWSGFLWCIFGGRYIGFVLKKMRLLQWLGKISYEVYLIHYLILWKVSQYLTNTIILAGTVIVISILSGWIIHEIFKKIIR
jgi:peptidoglycan/LPS O-acetylase OafA/YrhL